MSRDVYNFFILVWVFVMGWLTGVFAAVIASKMFDDPITMGLLIVGLALCTWGVPTVALEYLRRGRTDAR